MRIHIAQRMAAAIVLWGASSVIASQNPAEPRLAFEVASIRVVSTLKLPQGMTIVPGCGWASMKADLGQIHVSSVAVSQLISWAYQSSCNNVDLVEGLPEWARLERYDFSATLPKGTPSFTADGFFTGKDLPLHKMVRTLLADRLKLAMHMETRIMSAYVLTEAKGGHKLMPFVMGGKEPFLDLARLPPDSTRAYALRSGMLCGAWELRDGSKYCKLANSKSSLQGIADLISGFALQFQPVVDHTGITGEFNFYLEYDPDGLGRPNLAKALEEQAGLHLEKTKAPVDIWVIDHVEKPSDN